MPSRMIHESICNSQKLARVSCESEVIYERLITKADDFGRYFGTDTIVQNNCFGAGKAKMPNIEKALQELHGVGLIMLYVSDGERYLYITKWEEKQRRRSDKSRFPPPPQIADKCGEMPQIADKCGEMPLARAPAVNVNVNVNSNRKGVIVNECTSAIADTPTPPQKNPYGEFKNVYLTENDHSDLCRRYGGGRTERAIAEMSAWLKANGRAYKDYMAALVKWIMKNNDGSKVDKDLERDFANQNTYTAEQFEKMVSPLCDLENI